MAHGPRAHRAHGSPQGPWARVCLIRVSWYVFQNPEFRLYFFQTLESLPQSQGRWPLAAVLWCTEVAGWQHQGEQDRLTGLIWARVGPVGPLGLVGSRCVL